MKKRLLFFGTPDIAVPSLEVLAELNLYEIIGVGVFPDRKVGRQQVLQECAVKTATKRLGLPLFEIQQKSDLIEIYNTQTFDLALVIAFGMIFPAEILMDQKFINVHFSLLPKFRGASPVQSAILSGQKYSGITWQIMAPELDAGNVLFQKEFSIADKTTSEIWNDFAHKTADLFPEFLNKYFDQSVDPTPQKSSEVTFCGKFKKSDGEIFPDRETAQEIYQKYLAFTPWPGLFWTSKKGPIKLHDVSLKPLEGTLSFPCAENSTLWISKAQLSGKKAMPVSEILKGSPDIFEAS